MVAKANSAASSGLDVVLDAAVLGVSAVYPSQRAGIWRFVREWARELASREEVRLHLVSGGRAPWNELALEQARHLDPFLASLPHVWHQRPSAIPGSRAIQARAAGFAFRLARRGILSPTALAGSLQALQTGLHPATCPVPGAVYHSPYHALPESVKPPDCRVRSLTIHDMIPVLFPQWFGDTTPFRRAMASLRPQDTVIAVSESTRSDAIRLLGLDPSRVVVAYNGVSPAFTALDRASCRQELSRLGVPDAPFLLAVGTLEPRKNLPQLLDAFARLTAMPGHGGLHLVLTGARGWKNEIFDRILGGLGEARSRVILTGYMEERDLPILYGACEAFVHTSLYEGFGLPIAEAMASGAAVVCARNSSQIEVAGDVAELTDVHSADSIASVLARVLADPARLDGMRHAGPAQAGRFTWKACIDTYLEAWRCR